MKRRIVEWLEGACIVEHWLLHRENRLSQAGASLWWDWLGVPVCLLADWSEKLDQRWQTHVWKDITSEDA